MSKTWPTLNANPSCKKWVGVKQKLDPCLSPFAFHIHGRIVEPSKLNLSRSRKDDTKTRKSSPEKDYHPNDQYLSLGFQIPNVRRSLDPIKSAQKTWPQHVFGRLWGLCMSQEVAHRLAQLKLFVWVVQRPRVQRLVMSCTVAVHWPCNNFMISLPAVRHGLASLESPDQSFPAGSRDLSLNLWVPTVAIVAFTCLKSICRCTESPSWSFRQACCRAYAWWCCHTRAGHCIHNLQWACHTKTSLPPNLFGKSMQYAPSFHALTIPPTTDKAVAIQFLGDAYFHQITLIFVMSTAPCSPTCWYLKSWFFKLVFAMLWQN